MRRILCYVGISLLFVLITGPLLVFYGPFDTVRHTVVGSLMTTMSQRYWAYFFLSDQQINAITGKENPLEISKVDDNKKPAVKIDFQKKREIQEFDVSGKTFRGKVLLIPNPLSIQVGVSDKLPKAGETTSEIAKGMGAIAAINAGGFGDAMTGTGGLPQGVVIHQGKILYQDSAKPRHVVSIIGFDPEGRLLVGSYRMKELPELHLQEAVCFRPQLVRDSKGVVEEYGNPGGLQPRTAIGQRADGTVIFLVVDGRQPLYSLGCSYLDLQDIMIKYGAVTAANLDGGSSATMVLNNKVLNQPCNPLGERMVPTVFAAMP